MSYAVPLEMGVFPSYVRVNWRITMNKPVKCGEDYVRDDNWRPVVRDLAGAERLGQKIMPPDLKGIGFGVAVFEADDYFRICFGRKV